MKLEESINFDQKAYAQKISKPSYSFYELANNIYRKRRKLATIAPSALSTVATAIAAHHPASLFGLIVCFREEQVQENKLILLELEWRRRGQAPLPHRPVQDTIIPVILASVTGAMSYAINVDLTAPIHNLLQGLSIPGFGKAFDGYQIGAAYTSLAQSGLSSGASGIVGYAQNNALRVNYPQNMPNQSNRNSYYGPPQGYAYPSPGPNRQVHHPQPHPRGVTIPPFQGPPQGLRHHASTMSLRPHPNPPALRHQPSNMSFRGPPPGHARGYSLGQPYAAPGQGYQPNPYVQQPMLYR